MWAVNRVVIDPGSVSGLIGRNFPGCFAEHFGRCIYCGIYEPGSPIRK